MNILPVGEAGFNVTPAYRELCRLVFAVQRAYGLSLDDVLDMTITEAYLRMMHDATFRPAASTPSLGDQFEAEWTRAASNYTPSELRLLAAE